jgi:hypothetical protein
MGRFVPGSVCCRCPERFVKPYFVILWQTTVVLAILHKKQSAVTEHVLIALTSTCQGGKKSLAFEKYREKDLASPSQLALSSNACSWRPKRDPSPRLEFCTDTRGHARGYHESRPLPCLHGRQTMKLLKGFMIFGPKQPLHSNLARYPPAGEKREATSRADFQTATKCFAGTASTSSD